MTALTSLAHTLVYRPSYFNGEEPTGLGHVGLKFEPWGFRAMFAFGAASLLTMLVGLARRPAAERRRHAVFGGAVAVLLLPSLNGVYAAFAGRGFADISDTVEVWAMVALPVVLAIGIVRRGLLDIDVIVRRTTVYACSAGVVAAVYALVVWVTSTVVSGSGGRHRLVGTAAAAVVVMPACVRAGELLDRHFFGSRRDASVVLRALGETMAQSRQGSAALDYVAVTIQRELRVPFVAVDLLVDGDPVRAAAAGAEHESLVMEHVPLHGATGELGALLVARRTPREAFGARELDALVGIAGQVACASDSARPRNRSAPTHRSERCCTISKLSYAARSTTSDGSCTSYGPRRSTSSGWSARCAITPTRCRDVRPTVVCAST